MNTTVQIIEQHLHNIIDEVHPLFTPASDEKMLEKNENRAIFSRDFFHKNGNKFRMEWIVTDYFNPQKVKTTFKPAIQIE